MVAARALVGEAVVLAHHVAIQLLDAVAIHAQPIQHVLMLLQELTPTQDLCSLEAIQAHQATQSFITITIHMVDLVAASVVASLVECLGAI